MTYMGFPRQHWTRIQTNNAIECLNHKIECRIKAIGVFPNTQRALMLAMCQTMSCNGDQLGVRCYMNMDYLFKPEEDLLSDTIVS